jgi:CheY-like chemotaxis protein
MRKRKHNKVVSAEDGAQAVSAFRAAMSQLPREPPDIIFMDISMPVLDGFAATRQIREIEAEIAASLGPMETPPPSLVIALTGLASGRDQSEAFVSGFDLYMTKPVSFREVGRLLDNWQANGGATGAAIPHGSVTAPVG